MLFAQRTSAYRVANAILDVVEAYGSRTAFAEQKLDNWL